MLNQRVNKIAARALAASLFVVGGTVVSSSQGMAMDMFHMEMLQADAHLKQSSNSVKTQEEELRQLTADIFKPVSALLKDQITYDEAMRNLAHLKVKAKQISPDLRNETKQISADSLVKLHLNSAKMDITELDLTDNTAVPGLGLFNYTNLTSLNLTRNNKVSCSELGFCYKNLRSLDLTENTK